MPVSFSTTYSTLTSQIFNKMSNIIRSKRQTFDEWLPQGSKIISKLRIQPLMSCTIEPPTNLMFNKELYKFFKMPISTPQEQPIKEENKDSLKDEDPPKNPLLLLTIDKKFTCL